ncbi:NADH-cytochrome b5 reductase-like [Cimex lectularius]|uniref:NADH-cytochrome b5 reductase n=1 Tax=Cimex lectularius TaxID=79782 RepID=A0A8I6S6W0_CIMLE|nr:NADH-cytochrome b5 reductase-like [Cimex lectularius]XP_014259779.1 NADH-cytochrome b5 reductase-like [Cimex lectularius]XP_014259781.1 NADH-cytochrome b5 reductase-like [Cimex lectularius]
MRPEEPTEDDCCHNGCNPCVFDIYECQLERWRKDGLGKNSPRFDLLSETHFKTFVLSKVRRLTADTNLYTFTAVKDNESQRGLLPIKAGQHLILKMNEELKTNKLTTRAYTVIPNSEENQNCGFDVAIKLYENGLMSNYLKTLNVGDSTLWRGPYGDFSYTTNKYPHIIMISMGTGVAPMYAVSKAIISNDQDDTIITFLYGCKSSADIILRSELEKLSSFWNFHSTYFLSQNFDIKNKKYSEKFVEGRIGESVLLNFIKSVERDQFLICGSEKFCCDIKGSLIKHGVKESNIFIF